MPVIYKTKRYNIKGNPRSFTVPKKQFKEIPKCVRLASEIVPGLKEIIIFGSCARNEARYSSDVDLCMIADRISDPSVIIEIRSQFMNKIPIDTDVILTTPEEYKNNQSTFYKSIRKEGISIWQASI